MTDEQRLHPRLTRRFDAALGSASGRCGVRITSLSLGGCFVAAPTAPPVGSRVVVELQFESVIRVALRGEVVHVTDASGCGVQFVDTSLVEEELLGRGLRLAGLNDPFGRLPHRN